MATDTKSKERERKGKNKGGPKRKKIKPAKTKFIFGRELSIDQIMAGIKVMCQEAGIQFIEEKQKKVSH